MVTEFGMVTEVRPLQTEKAEPPIEVTEVGRVTEVRPLQPEKAEPPIEVTEVGSEQSPSKFSGTKYNPFLFSPQIKPLSSMKEPFEGYAILTPLLNGSDTDDG